MYSGTYGNDTKEFHKKLGINNIIVGALICIELN